MKHAVEQIANDFECSASHMAHLTRRFAGTRCLAQKHLMGYMLRRFVNESHHYLYRNAELT